MKKKVSIILIAVIALALVFSAVACKSDEDTTVNVSINTSTDGLSAYVTAVTRSYFNGTSNYVYFSNDASKTLVKMQSEKLSRGICVGYFTAGDFAQVIDSEKDLTVIAIDNYAEDGSINGYWVARTDWLKNAPKSSKKFTNALVNAIGYRSQNMNVSLDEAIETIKHQPTEYKLESFEDVNYYIAAFVIGSDDVDLARNAFVSKSVADINADYQGFAEGNGKLYDDCMAMYQSASAVATNDRSFESLFSFDMFGTLMSEYLAKSVL